MTTETPEIKEDAWYFSRKGKNTGPFTKAEMIELIQSSELKKNDLVWTCEMKEWQRAASVFVFSATKERKVETCGVGCIIELVGLIVLLGGFGFGVEGLFGLFVSVPLGIVIMIAGYVKSVKWICSNCGNRVEEKSAKICPTCKVQFSDQ